MTLAEELFGGTGRARTLAYLFENAQRSFGVRELAHAAGVDPGNLSRWLNRWVETGLLQRNQAQGRPQFGLVQSDELKPLMAFFQLQSRWAKSLRAQLEKLGEKVEAAAVFGSTASGNAKEESDIDLLLLTGMPWLEAQAAFKGLSRELGKPVNVLTYSRQDWEAMVQEGNPLALDIIEHAVLPLKGNLHATAHA